MKVQEYKILRRNIMTNLEWLLKGDSVIIHLVNKYLKEKNSSSNNNGLIDKYLQLINPDTLTWGNGYYGPKWISTHYTLLDLKYMEVLPDTKLYLDSLMNYINRAWLTNSYDENIDKMDLCIAGMFINLLSYGKIQSKHIYQIIDYVLARRMKDNGWNCQWNRPSNPHISSVHTTINVLEGLAEYIKQGYTYKVAEVKDAINKGIECLLSRQLYYKKGTNEPIHFSMVQHHFPPRWKYDYLRALEFLAREKYPYSGQMKPGLDLLKYNIKKGRLTKGTAISGLTHFPVENEKYGRFNTLRAYIILKQYAPELYNKLLFQEIID
jgi:hypothetical protein